MPVNDGLRPGPDEGARSDRPTAGSREQQLAATFVSLADMIVSGADLPAFLQLLVDRCVALFEIDAAGLMLAGSDGRLRVVACSNEAAQSVELAQIAADAGPCLESFALSRPVATPSIEARRDRWPAFARAAGAMGLQSSYATPMRLREQTLGTVNLFSNRTGAMDGADLAAAQALTDVATIGIVQERRLREAQTTVDQLQTALHSRIVIEQAKGVLATRAGVSMGEAFRVMRHHARSTNTPLREVARNVVDDSTYLLNS